MKTMILVSVATLTLGLSGALAQNATAPAPSSASASDGQFIDKQATGEFRAPKLVGVGVYDSANKSVGKVSDLMLDKDGAVKAVVISVGGFLGIGSKYVAVPFSAVHWQTEQRTVAVTPGAAPAGDNNGVGAPVGSAQGNMTANGQSATGTAPATVGGVPPSDQNRTATIDPAQAATYQGYPDRAVIDLSQDQLKSAPEFKYASVPASAAAAPSANGAMKP
jgi:sporulation protein YlmC with PRC-barrel domain